MRVGQGRRDIGIEPTPMSPTFATHVIDPMVDGARQCLVESARHRHRAAGFRFVRAFDETNATGPPMGQAAGSR